MNLRVVDEFSLSLILPVTFFFRSWCASDEEFQNGGCSFPNYVLYSDTQYVESEYLSFAFPPSPGVAWEN